MTERIDLCGPFREDRLRWESRRLVNPKELGDNNL
jgi:hypothetical protein